MKKNKLLFLVTILVYLFLIGPLVVIMAASFSDTNYLKFPGLNVPIQNNNIVRYKTYSVSGRGNTNYYNYDGISSIVLRGSFNPNL